jgi:anthranilate phosphoribosyltransferase
VIQAAISRLVGGEHLERAEAEAVMNDIMEGAASAAQIGAFLTALRMQGETIDEIVGCVQALRAHMRAVRPQRADVVDTCGTGGDGAATFNISTAAAFVVAGVGLAVAKHGNRGVTSRCGSADVLAALGVRLELTPEQAAHCIDEVGIGFCFAPVYHPAMKHAAGPRRELGVRTVFNVLGPLANPAGARAQVLGVYHPDLTEPLAHVLAELGAGGALVVHGCAGDQGLDELTTTGANQVSRLAHGQVDTFTLDARDLGLRRAALDELRGGDPEENARILYGVLDGSVNGARRDVVALNAGATLLAAGAVADLRDGLALARESLANGRALARLKALVAFTQAL